MSRARRLVARVETARGVLVVLLLGTVGLVSGGVAEAGCISANLPEAVRLPGGEEHPAGVLTLCPGGQYSPVASMHRAYFDGMPVGLLISRRGDNEADSTQRPVIMFSRDGRGRLHLYGFAAPSGARMSTYVMQPGHVARQVRTARGSDGEAKSVLLVQATGGTESER